MHLEVRQRVLERGCSAVPRLLLVFADVVAPPCGSLNRGSASLALCSGGWSLLACVTAARGCSRHSLTRGQHEQAGEQ